jgi:ligand-binding SRPBCC domain-containing protein
MAEFHYSFLVKAPVTRVAQFHHDTRALKRLTPPPIIAQIHYVEPLAENSVAEFTLWFGPLPIRWKAVHTAVDMLHGFTDVQQEGPLKYWAHTHTFIPVNAGITKVREHIEFEHHSGIRGLLSRLLFPHIGLVMLFSYRKWMTRRFLEE